MGAQTEIPQPEDEFKHEEDEDMEEKNKKSKFSGVGGKGPGGEYILTDKDGRKFYFTNIDEKNGTLEKVYLDGTKETLEDDKGKGGRTIKEDSSSSSSDSSSEDEPDPHVTDSMIPNRPGKDEGGRTELPVVDASAPKPATPVSVKPASPEPEKVATPQPPTPSPVAQTPPPVDDVPTDIESYLAHIKKDTRTKIISHQPIGPGSEQVPPLIRVVPATPTPPPQYAPEAVPQRAPHPGLPVEQVSLTMPPMGFPPRPPGNVPPFENGSPPPSGPAPANPGPIQMMPERPPHPGVPLEEPSMPMPKQPSMERIEKGVIQAIVDRILGSNKVPDMEYGAPPNGPEGSLPSKQEDIEGREKYRQEQMAILAATEAKLKAQSAPAPAPAPVAKAAPSFKITAPTEPLPQLKRKDTDTEDNIPKGKRERGEGAPKIISQQLISKGPQVPPITRNVAPPPPPTLSLNDVLAQTKKKFELEKPVKISDATQKAWKKEYDDWVRRFPELKPRTATREELDRIARQEARFEAGRKERAAAAQNIEKPPTLEKVSEDEAKRSGIDTVAEKSRESPQRHRDIKQSELEFKAWWNKQREKRSMLRPIEFDGYEALNDEDKKLIKKHYIKSIKTDKELGLSAEQSTAVQKSINAYLKRAEGAVTRDETLIRLGHKTHENAPQWNAARDAAMARIHREWPLNGVYQSIVSNLKKAPTPDQQYAILHVLKVYFDSDERRKAEEELKKQTKAAGWSRHV
jgi:hypothetical protein